MQVREKAFPYTTKNSSVREGLDFYLFFIDINNKRNFKYQRQGYYQASFEHRRILRRYCV
jgi:hypothetical protein